jgi:hypothetical protein
MDGESSAQGQDIKYWKWCFHAVSIGSLSTPSHLSAHFRLQAIPATTGPSRCVDHIYSGWEKKEAVSTDTFVVDGYEEWLARGGWKTSPTQCRHRNNTVVRLRRLRSYSKCSARSGSSGIRTVCVESELLETKKTNRHFRHTYSKPRVSTDHFSITKLLRVLAQTELTYSVRTKYLW